MKKILTTLAVGAAVIVGGYFLIGGRLPFMGQMPGSNKGGDGFSGTLKMMADKGVPLKCSYKVDEKNYGVGYMKGKKYAAEVVVSGKPGHVVMIDDCLWSWSDEQNKGAKMCFKADNGKSLWEPDENNAPATQGVGKQPNYTCMPTVVTDNTFALPDKVEFLDTDQMMAK